MSHMISVVSRLEITAVCSVDHISGKNCSELKCTTEPSRLWIHGVACSLMILIGCRAACWVRRKAAMVFGEFYVLKLGR